MLTIDLSGQVALVVGGSRGIGGGVTETLAQAGAGVAFTHTGNPDRQQAVSALEERICEAGGKATGFALDACDTEGTLALIDQLVTEHGRLDILVHNAGQNLARPVEESTVEEWKQYLDLNLTSAYNSVRAVVPPMVQAGRGRIILIGSSVVFDGGGGAIDYTAPKAGLHGMMMYLSRQYTRQGILTNVIHPCVVDTDLLRERYADEEAREKLRAQVPVGRLSHPRDIAGLVAFLASSWGDFICGQSILVDGGRTFFK